MVNTIKTQQEYDYMRREWLLGLVASGLTLNQIESGLEVARQKNTNFIPSVGTFIEWCKEGSIIALGLPSVNQIMTEFKTYSAEIGFSCQTAEQFPWSHPVMYWIVTDLRKHMRQYNQSEYEIEQRAALLVNKWATKLSNGEAIPKIRVQIEHKPEPVITTHYQSTQAVRDMWERIRAKRSRKNG